MTATAGNAHRRPVAAFRFGVTLVPSPPRGAPPAADRPVLCQGGFQECTGLDLELELAETPEGGRNNGVLQRLGRVKQSKVVLRRGMLDPADGPTRSELWQWFQDVMDGVLPVRRYDGDIVLQAGSSNDRRVVARWTFVRGLPARIAGPTLNARTGEVAVEEIQIAHEGLRMVLP